MKRFILPLIITMAFASLQAGAQSIINLGFTQNPLFEVFTSGVTAVLPADDSTITLGADLTVKGGSGTYTYQWTDAQGNTLGNESSLTVTAPGTYTLTVGDTCDCFHNVVFSVEPSAIANIAADGVEVEVAGHAVTVTGAEIRQASLFTTGGVMTALIAPESPVNSFSLPAVAPGIYLLQLVTAQNAVIIRKIQLF